MLGIVTVRKVRFNDEWWLDFLSERGHMIYDVSLREIHARDKADYTFWDHMADSHSQWWSKGLEFEAKQLAYEGTVQR